MLLRPCLFPILWEAALVWGLESMVPPWMRTPRNTLVQLEDEHTTSYEYQNPIRFHENEQLIMHKTGKREIWVSYMQIAAARAHI